MKKEIILSLVIFLCFSCKRSDIECFECSCVSFFDTTGLLQYHFSSFTPEQWKTMDYAEKLEYRQIPSDFLNKMSTNELFIQFIHMDMAKSVLLYDTPQKGFLREIPKYNFLKELYLRNDVVNYFTGMLNDVNIEKVKNIECRFYYWCLQMLSAQAELINKMNKAETKRYIDIAYKIMENMTRFSSTDKDWRSFSNYTFCTIAFANIMIKYNYEPFTDRIQSDKELQLYLDGNTLLDEYTFPLICDHMLEFYKQLK